MDNIKNYLLARLREASTWRGLVALLAALGISLNPEQIEAIVGGGLAIIGVIGVFFPDKASENNKPEE